MTQDVGVPSRPSPAAEALVLHDVDPVHAPLGSGPVHATDDENCDIVHFADAEHEAVLATG